MSVHIGRVQITRAQGWPVLRDALAADRAFVNGGRSFHGAPVAAMPAATGWLPQNWAQRMWTDRPTYVVWSYATPIGWRTHDGVWRVPRIFYSRTTSAHQGALRTAVDQLHFERMNRPDDPADPQAATA